MNLVIDNRISEIWRLHERQEQSCKGYRMAKPNLRVIRGSMSDQDSLTTLTQQCHELALKGRVLMEFNSAQDIREHYRAYGQKLSEIRELIPNKNEFGSYVREHDLDIGTGNEDTRAKLRSASMWLADNWSDFQKSGSRCPYSRPTDVEQWYKEQTGARKPRKRKAVSSPIELEDNSDEDESDDDTDDSDIEELPSLRSNGDPIAEAVNGLSLAIIEADAYVRNLLGWLDDKPARYEYFREKLNNTLENWKDLANNMKELEKRKR